MRNLTEILGSSALAEAVCLLRRPNVKTAILAGGTTLVPQARRDVQFLVDLCDLKLASSSAKAMRCAWARRRCRCHSEIGRQPRDPQVAFNPQHKCGRACSARPFCSMASRHKR
jgi:hypothetical protein